MPHHEDDKLCCHCTSPPNPLPIGSIGYAPGYALDHGKPFYPDTVLSRTNTSVVLHTVCLVQVALQVIDTLSFSLHMSHASHCVPGAGHTEAHRDLCRQV